MIYDLTLCRYSINYYVMEFFILMECFEILLLF